MALSNCGLWGAYAGPAGRQGGLVPAASMPGTLGSVSAPAAVGSLEVQAALRACRGALCSREGLSVKENARMLNPASSNEEASTFPATCPKRRAIRKCVMLSSAPRSAVRQPRPCLPRVLRAS